MADHRCWIVAELTEGGDPDAVLEELVDEETKVGRGQHQDGAVVLQGYWHTFDPMRPAVEAVADHLDRLVFVAAIEGGGGAVRSRYYDGVDDLGTATDSVDNQQTRWFVEAHFDYYATRYGIDGAV